MSREPICPVFGKCGGCSYQDKEYELQTVYKKNELKEALERSRIKPPENIPVYIKQEYGYRNRMDFVFSENGPGFRERGKFNKIVNFEKCYISSDGINNKLEKVIEWFRENRDQIEVFDMNSNTGTLRYATVRHSFFSGDSSITFILNSDSERIEEHKILIKKFADKYDVPNIIVGYVKNNTDQSASDSIEVARGSDVLAERLGPYTYKYHSQGFFQNNSLVTMDILHYVKDRAGDGYDVMLDLFGGVGTFGIFLHEKAKGVMIVDSSGPSIECAKQNIKDNNMKNASAYAINARDLSGLENDFKGKKALFILDPPRAGLHKKTVKFIRRVMPEKMIYVSCNPRQLGQDLKILKEMYDYSDIAAFDMFPQTRHIESVCVLTRKKFKIPDTRYQIEKPCHS